MKAILLSCALLILAACTETSEHYTGVAGAAGKHTPVLKGSEGNVFGYYEYLPDDFKTNVEKRYPIIFYWNGANAIKGDGRKDINKLLSQGLSFYIQKGHHYPAIVITGMLPDAENDDPHSFVEYILRRYEDYIDKSRVYMTGFSAGGGITVRYVAKHPEHIAAYIPVQASVAQPGLAEPSNDMAQVASWFIHNSGDLKADIWFVNKWNRALRDIGGNHKITRPDIEGHHSWKEAYVSNEVWDWLFSQQKTPKLSLQN